MLTVRSTINIASQTVPPIIPVVQGDTGRSILFTLADFTIPSDATATYYVQKPSGEAVYNNATISDNTVTVDLTAQSIAEVGDNYGQVRITLDDEVVTSFEFILHVASFRGVDATESTTEMNIFDEAVEQAAEEIEEAKDAALAEINDVLDNIVAEEFSESNSYVTGEYVIYDGALYRFTSDHDAAAWDADDVEAITVGESLESLDSAVSNLQEDLAAEYSTTSTYSVGDYCLYEGQLYKCTTAIETAEAWTAAHWDAVTVGEELSDLKGDLSEIGISEDVKQALLACFEQVAWIGDDGQDYYDALEEALYPPASLTSISAAYTQSGTVYDTDSLDDLKSDIVVTAYYSDGTTAVVTNYVLGGTLAEGTSTITVTYGGKTATFTVTVSSEEVVNITFAQGAIGADGDETNRVTGVIYDALHFDENTYELTVENGYSVYPYGYHANPEITYLGTKYNNNILYTRFISDSGYIVSINGEKPNGTLYVNQRNIYDVGNFGWVTNAIYSFENGSEYGYSFYGLGFVVKKDDGSDITPREIAEVVSMVKVEEST